MGSRVMKRLRQRSDSLAVSGDAGIQSPLDRPVCKWRGSEKKLHVPVPSGHDSSSDCSNWLGLRGYETNEAERVSA